jgi:hypothetical protein
VARELLASHPALDWRIVSAQRRWRKSLSGYADPRLRGPEPLPHGVTFSFSFGIVPGIVHSHSGLRRKLHRASCPKLLDRYTHRELAELTAAVEELPAIAWGC